MMSLIQRILEMIDLYFQKDTPSLLFVIYN